MSTNRGKYRPLKAKQGGGIMNVVQRKQLGKLGHKPETARQAQRKRKKATLKREGKRDYLVMK